MATLTGRTLGGYLIEEELGRGAMGVVFKARQLSMDRHVALKFLPKRLAQDEKVVGRFLREARAAGQLSHPHIVSVHDAGVVDGLHFIAMEFVDGTTVHKRVKDKGPFSEKETLEIGGQIADALRYAHGRGILHRDIKPDNFL
ncbi:MAG TPA: serine/threonine-protein kinase, partial [Planctomycetota bacterium]|nr:serine/threonine-protein kinase [Planctomycetota bacterium]